MPIDASKYKTFEELFEALGPEKELPSGMLCGSNPKQESDMNIYDWSDVPDGARVIEDTFNEVYEVFTKKKQKWLRQVGWQNPKTTKPIPENSERPCDFDPQCMYDQPWYRID